MNRKEGVNCKIKIFIFKQQFRALFWKIAGEELLETFAFFLGETDSFFFVEIC